MDHPVAQSASLERRCGHLAETVLTHTVPIMPVQHDPITVWVSEQTFNVGGRKQYT